MKFRELGNTGTMVSTVCLGSWVFGGDTSWGGADDRESEEVIKEALDLGVNFIDTAPIYGDGRSEEVIGKAIEGKRGHVVLATKCGLEKTEKGIRPNLTAAFIREEIERSLRRLRTDVIDLYQCHWPDPGTAPEESFAALERLKSEGKIKHIGVSNFSAELIAAARAVTEITSDQMQYSLFDRGIEKEVIPFCAESGISILSYGSLGGGILSGKYKEPPKFAKSDARSFLYKFYREPFWSKARAFVSRLEGIASARGVPVSQVAMNWVLACPGVSSCIVGCRKVSQLADNVGSSDWGLSDTELDEIRTYVNEVSG
ncbi:MAG: aldo/keto reductase [Candidatus Omnitrophica bacterium]|nr:aldo/keto reductase [Candidatus Omnitrophota bacterium]MDD5487492.1 aldo/keto reductase [Candidatus Omnitrophota bacterium]